MAAVESSMVLQPMTSSGRTRGGGVFSVNRAEPYWDWTWRTQALKFDRKAELQAWWMSLRGGVYSFLAHDPRHPIPHAYDTEAEVLALPRGGGLGAFDGRFELTAVAAYELQSVSAVALRAPAGFELSAGDYISIVQSPRRSLHRVVEAVTAGASGNFTAGSPILVEPAVKTAYFTAGAIADIIRPRAEFVPDQSRYEDGDGLTEGSMVLAGFSKVAT